MFFQIFCTTAKNRTACAPTSFGQRPCKPIQQFDLSAFHIYLLIRFLSTNSLKIPVPTFFFSVETSGCPPRSCQLALPRGLINRPSTWGVSHNRGVLPGTAVTTRPGSIHSVHQRRTGAQQAKAELSKLLMPDLRKIAACCFRGECPGHTLNLHSCLNGAIVVICLL